MIAAGLAIARLASFVTTPGVSAQMQDGARGTWTLVPPTPERGAERGYTATDDLWQWREGRTGTTIRTGPILTVLEFDASRSDMSIRVWDDTDIVHMTFGMEIDQRFVPDMDSDQSGMLTVSGKSEGRLRFAYWIGEGDERAPGALTWSGNLAGEGKCQGDECEVALVITGRINDADGRRNCGDLTLRTGVVVDRAERSWTFTDVSQEVSSEVITTLRTSNKGELHCYIGETEKGVQTAEIGFYHGDPIPAGVRPAPYALGAPDRIVSGRTEIPPTRVMPGDNVKLHYTDLPMQIRELTDPRGGASLLGSQYTLVRARHDLEIDLRFGGRGDEEVRIGGEIRGIIILDQDSETEVATYALPIRGQISGGGVYDPRSGVYGIRISGDLILIGPSGKLSDQCGSMEISVAGKLEYDRGPQVTLMPNGSGTISADVSCILDTLELMDDI